MTIEVAFTCDGRPGNHDGASVLTLPAVFNLLFCLIKE
jgi:hypothetical protein